MYYSIQIIPDSSTNYINSNWDGNNFEDKFIDGWNTWADWHLLPSTRPLVVPPTVKTNYIELPGGDGTIDISEIVSGHPIYNDREGSWEFYVTREYSGYSKWITVYNSILNNIQGKRVKIIFEDDPNYYYLGRVSVNQWQSEKDWSKITIDYKVAPYRTSLSGNTKLL